MYYNIVKNGTESNSSIFIYMYNLITDTVLVKNTFNISFLLRKKNITIIFYYSNTVCIELPLGITVIGL